MPEPSSILDTVVLRTLAFAHPDGIDILLTAVQVSQARFPAEVYNQDEALLPLNQPDGTLSELARGLRYAQRQVLVKPETEAARYTTWLQHAQQLPRHLQRGSLSVDPLLVRELARRQGLMQIYGISRGEAACLTLAERDKAQAIFLSSDDEACKVAQQLGIAYLTLTDVLELWVKQEKPTLEQLRGLVSGLRQARFGLTEAYVKSLEVQLT